VQTLGQYRKVQDHEDQIVGLVQKDDVGEAKKPTDQYATSRA